jgi:hypothetical protein
MPLLQLRRNFKEAPGENALRRVIVNPSEPKKFKPVFAQTLRLVGITKAQLGREVSTRAALKVLNELWPRMRPENSRQNWKSP